MKLHPLSILLLSLSASSAWASQVINHKSPQCGCCGDWTKHMQDAGFEAKEVLHQDMMSVKQKLGVTPQLASCHTAEIDGYVFEGHIPAKDIQDFLANPPEGALGLAVPGMPLGSPGMEYGDRKDSYTVYAFDKDGRVFEFRHHKGNQ